jgi:hypothetical protein
LLVLDWTKNYTLMTQGLEDPHLAFPMRHLSRHWHLEMMAGLLAAGTSNGRVVFYDVRGKPQPFTVLRAYSSSEVDSLSTFIVSSLSGFS